MNIARTTRFTLLLGMALLANVAAAQSPLDHGVDAATQVLDEIMAVPVTQIPQALLADASGVAIIPNVVKGGFVVGVRHGRGVILIRDAAGNWHPPMFATLTGGSVGWQAGIQATDVVLVFKTRRSLEGLMNGKLTVGVDAAAAAGPVGRQAAAATDARLKAEILSYSRSRGLFAGVSIDGSSLQLDHASGNAYYGEPVVDANGEAIRPLDSLPASAIRLMQRLAFYTGSPQPVPAEHASGQTLAPAAHTAPIVQPELLRRRLAASWHELSPLLDARWKEYLMLPPEVLSGLPRDSAALGAKLQQYDTIAADPRYAALNRSGAFAATHRLLREYVAIQSAGGESTLQLPPPPGRE